MKRDVRTNFKFETIESEKYVYQVASGQLGVPGEIQAHRSKSSQSTVSAGTGDDAGHLIGRRFGAPGGVQNLGPQNWIQNQYGTFKDLENAWELKLKRGVQIFAVVQDIYRKGETRPFKRRAEWDEKLADGSRVHQELIFANPQTAKSRTQRGIESTVADDNVAKVFDFFSKKRIA